MNVNALIEQAVELANSSKHKELECLCTKILKKKSKCFDALQLLGVAQVEQGRVKQGIKTLKTACKMDVNHASVRINLANAYWRDERVEDSLRIAQEAVKLDSTQFESYLVLGNSLKFLKSYESAEQAYLNVIRLNPTIVEAYDNLAECVMRQGRLHESIRLRFQASEMFPKYTPLYVNLVNVLMYAGCKNEALEVANVGLRIPGIKQDETIHLWIDIAIYAWLMGNISLLVEALNNSQRVSESGEEIGNIDNQIAYQKYLTKLLKTFDVSAPIYHNTKRLYFIGDSHSLSVSGVVVNYLEDSYVIESLLILGGKVWFLSCEMMNEYRAGLAHAMASIPQGASVVVGFGEIDCRASEGILLAYQEKGIDYKKTIPEMIHSYIQYVLCLAKEKLQKVVVYGVPAPSFFVLNDLDQVTQTLLLDIVCFFNNTLKFEAEIHQLLFIDVYAATADKHGKSNMKYHLDSHHLLPSVYPLLFDDYLVTPKTSFAKIG